MASLEIDGDRAICRPARCGAKSIGPMDLRRLAVILWVAWVASCNCGRVNLVGGPDNPDGSIHGDAGSGADAGSQGQSADASSVVDSGLDSGLEQDGGSGICPNGFCTELCPVRCFQLG